MKTFSPHRRLRAGAAALALLSSLAWGSQAHAAGTLSGTDIDNVSLLSFSVGGVAQNQICSSPSGNSTSTGATSGSTCNGGGGAGGTFATFKVDNKVNLTVVETGGQVTSVVPGSSNNVTTFTVTNNGNTAQGYTLVAANQAATSTIAGTADSFDVTTFQVFVDSNNNGVFNSGVDTAAAISTLAPDATVSVFVLANIPAVQANGTQANITLTATTTTAGTTTAVSETTGANTTGVDIVFADPATVESNFIGASNARNAQGTARDAYRVGAAVISVTKTSSLICDPSNGSGATRKNIPGAIVRWTITVSNASGASASAILSTVTDTLNTNTTFDANLVTGVGDPATISSCTSASGAPTNATGNGFSIDVTGDTRGGGTGFPQTFKTTVSDGDGATAASGVVTIDYALALPAVTGYAAGELKPGELVTVFFQVTIN